MESQTVLLFWHQCVTRISTANQGSSTEPWCLEITGESYPKVPWENAPLVSSPSRHRVDTSWPKEKCKSHSVVSDSLRPHGLYSPWNSPGQNTEVDSLSLLQAIFPTQGLNQGLPHCGQILTSWATRKALCLWGKGVIQGKGKGIYNLDGNLLDIGTLQWEDLGTKLRLQKKLLSTGKIISLNTNRNG